MVENCRYLVITISTKNIDLDLKKQMKKIIYGNSNLPLRKFSSCSVSVKCYLFKTYCSTVHYAPMWFDCTKTGLKKLKVAYNNHLIFTIFRAIYLSVMLILFTQSFY